ncbi:MAG: branched-chain amino acid aminotransferase [Candidatus Woesearchaeota archaeon]|jgi:branched-chain amino acid aminotransferase
MQTKKIWMNGHLVDPKLATISVLTHTLHYGSGVFEGIRYYMTNKGRAIFRLPEHVDRLFYSAEAIGLKIPYSKDEITDAIIETVIANEFDEGYIRPLVYFDEETLGVNPSQNNTHVAIATWPWSKYLGDTPLRLTVPDIIRIHPRSTVTDAKICGHYVNSILANTSAKEAGFDDALLLDYKGHIAEGPVANLFILKGDVLLTPKSGSILPGITRDTMMVLAKELKYEVHQLDLTLDDFQDASEAFVVGTASEVVGIASVDELLLGTSHDVKDKLQQAYSDCVHGKAHTEWLTYVSNVPK